MRSLLAVPNAPRWLVVAVHRWFRTEEVNGKMFRFPIHSSSPRGEVWGYWGGRRGRTTCICADGNGKPLTTSACGYLCLLLECCVTRGGLTGVSRSYLWRSWVDTLVWPISLSVIRACLRHLAWLLLIGCWIFGCTSRVIGGNPALLSEFYEPDWGKQNSLGLELWPG